MSYEGPALVVVGEQYCAPYPIELTVSKNVVSLSGGSFEITNPDGQVVFKMDGHAFSIRDKRVLLDAEGAPILCACKKLMSMHDEWKVCRGAECEKEGMVFTVAKASVIQFKTHLHVFLAGNVEDDRPDFTIKGNFLEREAQILQGDGDTVIAEIKRKFSVGKVLLDKHTFCTLVCPGIDQAFVATLVVVMDAIHED